MTDSTHDPTEFDESTEIGDAREESAGSDPTGSDPTGSDDPRADGAGKAESGDGETKSDPLRPEATVTAHDPEVFDVIEDTLLDLWNVVDDLSRIRVPDSKYYRVTIFGSSRMREGDELYASTRRLARYLAGLGADIITGGGPGLMRAANEGEVLGDTDDVTRSFGLNIELTKEEEANPFVEKAFTHRTFFSRLHHFVRLSSAFVVVKGGIGTTLEAMMIWQLLQVRHVTDRPFILVGGMWRELVEWARENMMDGDRRLADPEDIEIPVCVDTVEAAAEIIEKDLEAFQDRNGD